MQKQSSKVADRPHLLGTPGHSLALHYEVTLKESLSSKNAESKPGQGPSQYRINTCFQMLDEVLPQLGVYQQVMRLIRDELHAAVYSSEYTSSGKKTTPTQPLPWCVIAGRLMAKKNGEHTKLKAEISSLKEQLYTCEADLEKASSALESHRHEVKERDSKIQRLGAELRARTAECERHQKIVNQHQRAQDRMRQEVEFRMYSLRSTIGGLKEDNTRLKYYQAAYDKLQDVLSTPHSCKPGSLPANTKNELKQHVSTSSVLKTQLMTVQNSLLDEHDRWTNSCITDDKISLLPAAIIQHKRNFEKNIEAISNELSLLVDHAHSLTERCGHLEEQLKSPEHRALVLPSHPANPLVPQLQTTSKYAIMVYASSDGGKTFYPLKEARFCRSCGEKSVVCPHKAGSGELVILLPVNSTHLKISRPTLRISSEPPPLSTSVQQPPGSFKIHNKQNEQSIMHPEFEKIWTTFKNKYPHYQSTIARDLNDADTLLLAHQFYASLLIQDDRVAQGKEEQPTTVMESLFLFISERYIVAEIAPQATYDFITALVEHHTQHKELLVLSHILCGSVDCCAFRYLLTIADLVNLMPWNSIKEFSPFVSLLFPALQEEDVEHLTMNFIAHSENQISSQLVLDYFILLLLRHRDPLVLQLESKLMEHPCKKLGSMMEVEFAEAMEGLVPLTSFQLSRWFYLQAMVQVLATEGKRETLPIKRLAYIATYLYFRSFVSGLKSKVEQLAQQSTAVVQPVGHQQQQQQPQTAQQQHSSKKQLLLYTLEHVRNMANRMKAVAQHKIK